MKTYTVKPLEWEEISGIFRAEAPLTRFIYWAYMGEDVAIWICSFTNMSVCESIDAAKLAAERHHIEQMERGLVEVKSEGGRG